MWRRRSWFSLKGKAGIPGQTEGRPATSIGPRVPPVGSLQQRAMEANAALRAIVRRDTGEGYRAMLTRMAQESGIATPTAEDLIPPAPRTWPRRDGGGGASAPTH